MAGASSASVLQLVDNALRVRSTQPDHIPDTQACSLHGGHCMEVSQTGGKCLESPWAK